MADGVKKMTLEALRVNKGYSQKCAAALLGISNKTLCAWENGKAFPKQPQIEALCKLYGVHYDFIEFDVNKNFCTKIS